MDNLGKEISKNEIALILKQTLPYIEHHSWCAYFNTETFTCGMRKVLINAKKYSSIKYEN